MTSKPHTFGRRRVQLNPIVSLVSETIDSFKLKSLRFDRQPNRMKTCNRIILIAVALQM